jgi:uncharacterized protein YrrD
LFYFIVKDTIGFYVFFTGIEGEKRRNPMQIKEGTRVETSTGERVGSVGRVVIDPRSKEITHIVVEKGFLFGTDRVLPASLIADSDDERLVLSGEAGDLEQFPEFEVSNFVMLDERDLPTGGREELVMGETAPSAYPYPATLPHHFWSTDNIATAPYNYHRPGYSTVTQQNIPDVSVALKKGAAIVCEDGKKAGELYEVLVDKRSNQAVHLVMSGGFLSTEKKLIPVDWIVNATEEEIHIGARSDIIERLKPYEDD